MADRGTAERFGVRGVLIIRVQKGSAAEGAGLRGTGRNRAGSLVLGDVIVGVGEKSVTSRNDLLDALDEHKVGDVVEVHLMRDGNRMSLNIKLQALS